MIRVIILGMLALLLFYIGSHKRASTVQLGFLTVFFLCGAFLVIQPEAANFIAASVGVGRGADLLLYFSVLAGIYLSSAIHIRIRNHEEVLIMIVRELALARPISEEAQTTILKGGDPASNEAHREG
jgi:hypothetical protein